MEIASIYFEVFGPFVASEIIQNNVRLRIDIGVLYTKCVFGNLRCTVI